MEAADFPDELDCAGSDFVFASRGREIMKHSDVSAHGKNDGAKPQLKQFISWVRPGIVNAGADADSKPSVIKSLSPALQAPPTKSAGRFLDPRSSLSM
jgi:hypothetical protein